MTTCRVKYEHNGTSAAFTHKNADELLDRDSAVELAGKLSAQGYHAYLSIDDRGTPLPKQVTIALGPR